jgi:uncharacterized DUF497 family protein
MINLNISATVLVKLGEKHNVSRLEVEQCFQNRLGKLLQDNREAHKTNPPTNWFIAQTNKGRSLKIVYILNGAQITLRSAFEPNQIEMEIYRRFG